jgi:uncharacterized protein (UPF0332 family)
MTADQDAEIRANLKRADEALGAAKALLSGEYYDSVASRAYYAAFYAATALLLSEGLEFSKHSGLSRLSIRSSLNPVTYLLNAVETSAGCSS